MLALAAGCDSAPPASGSDALAIVASSNVYGDVAQRIGGDAVTVTSLMSDPSADPHSYEANPQNLLALSKADIVIANGGGYDDFIDTMLSSADNPDAVVLHAVELSGLGGGDEFNEHVWYDFGAMSAIAAEIAAALSAVRPADQATFEANAATFTAGLTELESAVEAIRAVHQGAGVAITEPVPVYLLDACGLDNRTPEEFSEAIEEGFDVPALALRQTLELMGSGEVALLAYNEQTTSPETERVLEAARSAGVPVVSLTETLPAGTDYLGWMAANLTALEEALA
jgi:zinc/manganese transport system substrate-binding protein